jgi:DNA polymerase-4
VGNMAAQPKNRRYILHADLDAFYTSVEQRDNPTLRGKPVVVGGSSESRGVVAAASYEARKFGIHSAMPMKTALRMSSTLVRIAPRFHRYREVSEQIMGLYKDISALVEPMSLDEAYIDITNRPYPEKVATDIKTRIKHMTGLAVTIGGGTSKTISKIASQVGKPNGLLLVKSGEEKDFLDPLDISLIPGVGPKTETLLNSYGVSIIGDLASSDIQWLRTNLGIRGLQLKDKALGIDNEPVIPYRETKSMSAENTLTSDTDNLDEIDSHIKSLSQSVSEHLRKSNLKGKTVRLKLRLSDFKTFARQSTLNLPTDDSKIIHNTAMMLFVREYIEGNQYRLLGVGVSNFSDSAQLPLF